MGFEDRDGKESEWNEANLKSERLHEAQKIINYSKMNPLGITDGKYNYIWLAKNIEILMGEGRSKYSPHEKKEVDKLREYVNKSLKFRSPHIPITIETLSGKKQSFVFDSKNFDFLMELLYQFEMLVRDYNDKHGLTTKNKGTSGLF